MSEVLKLKTSTLSDKQRELRKGKFTASVDAPAIMSGDPYKINDRYLYHTNDPRYVEPDFSDVWPVQLGVATEELNLRWAARKYGPVTRQGEVVIGLESKSWTAATLDGWLQDKGCPIEAKCVGGQFTLEDIIARYMPQLTWQMLVTGVRECAITVIIGGREPVVEFVPLNRPYARELWARASAFWLCVQTRTPPVALPAVLPPPLAVKEIDMGDNLDWCRQADRWIQAYGAAQIAKEAEKALKALVPADAKRCYGRNVEITKNRAGAMSLREVGRSPAPLTR